MKYEQAKPLVEELAQIALLYHASSLLRVKLYAALDRYLPTLDEGCRTRGCPCYDERDTQPKTFDISSADYPPPDSGFAKL